ncbi:LysM domain-containing protein [Streptomyces sp. 1114.5]|uniref:LysM peptidoglycan-binding domain-containing protein n=1 Tax=unclassified Streptomyces TaxID=2593676 RepID=UPI000BCB4DB1|nr:MULTISPECIES: transglycosylase family protein [unclassified Streptomyces]RKT08976.1 LysM domain-containing protein [Streptomyces sp. 1114.5]SOB79427.1 LysM domain-containing protein [Streptomyces sp. 1331.2]
MNPRHETAAATDTTATKRHRVRMAVIAGAAVAALPVAGLVTATSASAATTSTWDSVAQCESGGNWSISTGNGFHGGLQFTPSTWKAYGGTAYAPQANQATKAQQITVAEKVLAAQGPGAWPVCSQKAGLSKGGAPAAVDTSAGSDAPAAKPAAKPAKAAKPATKAAKPAAAPQQAPRAAEAAQGRPSAKPVQSAPVAPTNTAGGNYTVKSGDTLSEIAAKFGTDTDSLYGRNVGVIGGDPDLIFPGQTLTV